MTGGRLIAVVGPSGVGKDSVMTGICAALPDVRLVRRTITRAQDLGGEAFTAVSPDAFRKMAQEGAFCLHWGAHDLRYGIPAQVWEDVANGADCLVNLSRGALLDAAAAFPALTVLHLTASTKTLAKRLGDRGRETAAEIEKRLAQAARPLPEGLHVVTLNNDGPLHETVALAVAALQPAEV